jgi:hypothetical protein
MAFEYPTSAGVVRLIRAEDRWLLHYAGRQRGEWPTPDEAGDLLEWRPLGESI